MGGKTDVVKGRIEEAAGTLTGDNKLRDKGQTDQAVGHVKQAAAKAVNQAKDITQKVVDKAKGVV
ncbi:MAG: CsbD family protein [Planctomycetota bacterium]|nr:CsbD family protein [Planctomycetota bacterium]